MAKATIQMSMTNEGIHNNGEVVKRLTITARNESEAIHRLTEEARRDSRFVKILTFVALLYLPASLMAVSTVIHPVHFRPALSPYERFLFVLFFQNR